MSRPGPVPDLDWDAERAREIGTAALDLWTELLERLPRMPAAPDQTASEVAADIELGISGPPTALGDIVSRLRPLLFERSSLTGHPGFMAYISGSGTIPGAAADLIAAGLNPNVGGWTLSPAATELELAVTAWLARDVFGLPDGAGGLMTSGGAASNFTALKAARDLAGGPDTRRHGVQDKRVAMYTSAEAHATNAEAADMLGLGSDAMRIVAADGDLRMLPDALDHALSVDISAGVRPAAVIASAGTTATGAIDPLNAVADVCAHHRVWLHVDAAYGGAAMLAPGLRPLLAGIERADSIAFDPHKWLYTPQPSACLLVREPSVLRSSFSIDAAYVRDDPALSGRGINIGEFGQAWSRPWMALKVWLSLLAHGTDAYARRIQHDVELARYLHERAAACSDLEPMGAVTLSIACFRYVPEDLSGGDHDAYLNRLNERLMTEIRRKGRTFPSNAELDGRYALRACIVNFRTEAGDIDALLEDARTLGALLDAELR